MPLPPYRIGFGYDTHRFADGRELWLGGIKLAYTQGLLGHSDADVLLHAICDAILGAANLRDIGFHFPDTDPAYQGADSAKLLAESHQKVLENGYELGNLDCTVIAEAPKLNPHVPAMQARIADILGAKPNQISIKATRNEGMGALRRREGIAVHCVALLVLSDT